MMFDKVDIHNGIFKHLAFSVVLINVLVVAVAVFSLFRSYDKYQQRAEITTQNLASVLSQNIESTVDKVELGLLVAEQEIERELAKGKPDTEELSAFMIRLQSHLPWVIGLRATDEQGWVAYGSDVPKDTRVNLADRPYFILHHDDPHLGLYINSPVMSRINKVWVINFAHRLNYPDGRFAGVVFANISLENFDKMFGIIDVGEHGSINLRDQEMKLIMRKPVPTDLASSIGKKDISPEYQHMLDAGKSEATFHTPTSFDNVPRVVSYRKIGRNPLFVSVGLAEKDFLAEWRNEALQLSGLVLVFILGSISGVRVIGRAWKRQIQALDNLAREEEKFHTIADYTYDWEYWEGVDRRILYMSPSCRRVTGYAVDDFIADPELLPRIIHAEDRHLLERHRHDARYLKVPEIDFRIVRADGEIRWISHCCQPVFDQYGKYLGQRVTNRDITERHLLATEINSLAQAVDHNPTGIAITNQQGELRYTNYAYTRITGYEFGEAYKKTLQELIATEMTAEEFKACQMRLNAGKQWGATLINRHKDGELCWEQIIAVPIYNEVFQVTGYLYLRTDITEQKTSEQKLQLLSYSLDNVGETILLMPENDPHFLYVNQTAGQNLGYSRDELTGGMGLFDIDPRWSSEVWKEFWLELCTSRRMQFESTHRASDGRIFPVEVTCNYFEYDGKIYSLAICRDISERKQAEAMLLRLNRELRAISNCNQTLLKMDDEQSLLNEICRIICEEAGYRMAWVGFPENDDAKTLRPVAWAGVEDGYLLNANISWAENNPRGQGPAGVCIRSGEKVYIQDFAADSCMEPWCENALQRGYRSGLALPLKDEKQMIFGSLLIYSTEANAISPDEIRLLEELASDLAFGITVLRARIDRKQIAEKLQDSEERLRLTLEATQIGVWDWDLKNDSWYASPTYYSMLGYQPETGLADRSVWMERVHPDDRAYVSNKIQDVLTRDFQEYQYEARMLHADGHYRWQQVRGFGIRRDDDGKVIRLLGIRLDIDARKQNEEQLRHYKDHLEEEIELRTSELVLARNAAEAANRAKSVFLANMSHELRTPLNAILGFSNIMRKNVRLSEEQRQNLDIINRSGEHLLSLINDVLEMAKIEAGRVQLENASFDLGSMVRDVTDMMGVRAKEKELRLLIDQSSCFPRFIVGDEARLRQVLINLVGNAIKFTQQGGITVRLGTKENAISHLLIEVEDTGPGIGEEDQQRVFEPFVQLGRQGNNKGTGLGLSITRQFVELMGGKLSLDSTPGKGSLFRIDLPLTEAHEADIVSSDLITTTAGAILGLDPGQPEYRILIVEDQLENQLLLIRLMEAVGFQVKLAENGKQAVELFQSWQPHFIWMDRQMPVMDGVTAMKKIRALPGGTDVKIVAVTASAFKEQRAEMLDAGMDDFVRKPYRFNEIYECLARQLGVGYIYEGIAETNEQMPVLTPEMLMILPDTVRKELKAALESLEIERIYEVVAEVETYDAQLRKILTHLADNYDYPTILKALPAD